MKYSGFDNGLIERCYSLLEEIEYLRGIIKNMNLNVNTSDSPDLNKPEENWKERACEQIENDKKRVSLGISLNPNHITIDNSYTITERGKKVKKWIDNQGKWHEQVL